MSRSQRPPGEGESHATSLAGAVVMVVFGMVWTAITVVITRMGQIPVAGKVFPMIGIALVGFGIYQVRHQLKLRKLELSGATEQERAAFSRRTKRQEKLLGSGFAFIFLLGWTAIARSMPIPIFGKLAMLIGLVGLFVTGKAIYRQISAWVKDS